MVVLGVSICRSSLFNIVLYQPEIPPNTGNIIRLCANTGATLHLVEPLGFRLDEARVRRAGLDYHDLARVHRHADWHAFHASCPGLPLWAYSTRGRQTYSEVQFRSGDGLVFGPETRGLPDKIIEEIGAHRCLRLPMVRDSRSLNLSNCVAVGLFEAWRQIGFADNTSADVV